VAKQAGGRRGGGARLTPWGRRVLERYRAIETTAQRAVAPHLRVLEMAGSALPIRPARRLAPPRKKPVRPRAKA
jgi:molybdenum-dependent DNA-binding transcriptional regulator ModE